MVLWLSVPEDEGDDEGEPVAVTRVDGKLLVRVVHDVTSEAVDDVGIGLTGVSEREMDEVVAVPVLVGVEAPGVSELEAGTDTVCDVVEVTDVVLRVVAV